MSQGHLLSPVIVAYRSSMTAPLSLPTSSCPQMAQAGPGKLSSPTAPESPGQYPTSSSQHLVSRLPIHQAWPSVQPPERAEMSLLLQATTGYRQEQPSNSRCSLAQPPCHFSLRRRYQTRMV